MRVSSIVILLTLCGCTKSTSQQSTQNVGAQTPTVVDVMVPTVDVPAAPVEFDVMVPATVDVTVVDVDESQFVPLNVAVAGRHGPFRCLSTGVTGAPDMPNRSCYRDGQICNMLRRQRIDRGQPANECVTEPGAWCFTMTPTSGGSFPSCVSEEDGYAKCVLMRQSAIDSNRSYVQYRNLSRCVLVR